MTSNETHDLQLNDMTSARAITSNPRLRPVIRVFVSSTFSDMRHERNALQAEVFPKLEQLCQTNGFQFQAIDLRWGVSSEAGLDHRTMRICLEELRRSQEVSPEPNFLVLLGDRYGWRPLPEEISQGEFDRLVAATESGGAGNSPIAGTHGKTARQVLEDWYRCDENVLLANPPETGADRAALNYILQPRTRNLGDRRDYTRTQDAPPEDTQDWLEVQQVLWRIINAAFPVEALDQRFENIDWTRRADEVCDREHPKRAIPQIARFQASATEQEIWGGALSAPNAERHVLAFFREIENGDKFSPGDVKEFFDRTDIGDLDKTAAARQNALKEAIRLRLGADAVGPIPFSRLKIEDGKVLVAASSEDTERFCKSVEDRLRPIIERQIEQYWHPPRRASVERTVRELEIEQQEHARIAQERGRAKTFVGRADKLAAIRDYLLNDSTSPLVVHGASGCGKTALMARAAQEVGFGVQGSGKTKNDEPGTKNGAVLCARFLGTTPRSSDLRALLTSLCQELRLRYPREGELPTDIKLLEVELHEQFKNATAEQPLILFLDALDQLADTDGGRLLHWVPRGPLPAHVKLVVSCLSDRDEKDPAGQPYAELQRRQLPEGNLVDLNELSEADARTLLFDRWLAQVGRTVSRDQRERIEQRLTSDQCRQPIYLKLLFEEARLWRSYDKAPRLGENVPALLDQLFHRLRQKTNHGELLVERVLGYLAASREGLAENEILEILFLDPEYKKALNQATETTRHEMPPNANRIPIAICSRLRFDLDAYLTERAATGANVLTFYHRQVEEWVHEHFAKLSDQHWQPHRLLADYFETVDLGPRLLAELPWQLKAAGEWTRLVNCMTERAIFLALYTAEFQYDLLDYWGSLPAGSDPSVAYCHAVERFSEIAPGAAVLCEFTHQTARFLAWMSHYAAAEELYRKAIVLAVSAHGSDSLITASAQSNLAELLTRSGRHAEAGDLYRSVLQVAESHPEESRDLGISYSNQGSWYHSTGQDAESEQAVRRALELHVASVGSDSEEAAVDRLNLARILTKMSRADEAEPICREALAYYRHCHTPSHPETARCQASLGLILEKTGRAEEAQSLYLEALAALEQAINVNVDELTALRHNFAWALMLTSRRQPSSGFQP